jgi:hypothetical protein
MKNFLTRRHLLSLGGAALATPTLFQRAIAGVPPVLVELFTSQGCSSCPPADVLAGQLAKRSDVIVASLNVDYWDYLGWRDTLAKPEYTKRQFDYAHMRGDGQSYTPQMVINGAAHAVGSNRAAVEAAIENARGMAGRVPIALTVTKKEIQIDVAASAAFSEATVFFFAIAPAVKVNIERGENSGKSIVYHNVARHVAAVGMWKGKAATFELPRKAHIPKDCTSCLAVLQNGEQGEVLGLQQTMITQA